MITPCQVLIQGDSKILLLGDHRQHYVVKLDFRVSEWRPITMMKVHDYCFT